MLLNEAYRRWKTRKAIRTLDDDKLLDLVKSVLPKDTNINLGIQEGFKYISSIPRPELDAPGVAEGISEDRSPVIGGRIHTEPVNTTCIPLDKDVSHPPTVVVGPHDGVSNGTTPPCPYGRRRGGKGVP